MSPKPYLSIIIPAFNEESRIEPTLQRIETFLTSKSYDCEVIVVDDGSSDQTTTVVTNFIFGKDNYRLIKLGTNRGKGAAVRAGMLAAQGEFRLFTDADLSTPIEEVDTLLSHINQFEVVMASRRVKGATLEKRQPLFREGSGRVFSVLVRLINFRGYLDTQCGFKLFQGQAAEKIFKAQQIEDFGFDVEIIFLALKKFGYQVKEVPVRWRDSPHTKVRLFRDSAMMFWDLIKIRLRN